MMIGSKRSVAMKKERKVASYTSPLPPCKICGAKASGLHYGVNTCEACKGFFRRAVKCQKKYRCFRQQKCDVTGGRSVRTSCPFCRLQKCLDMGMAHTAIKTGRYTHAKRTENIMEVKRLESYQKMSPVNHASDTSLDSTYSESGFEYYKPPNQDKSLETQSLNNSYDWLGSFSVHKKEKSDFISSCDLSNAAGKDAVVNNGSDPSLLSDRCYGIQQHCEPSSCTHAHIEEIVPHLLVQGLVHGVSVDPDEICKNLTIQSPVSYVQNNVNESEGVYISIPSPPLESNLALSPPLSETSLSSPGFLSHNTSSSPPTSDIKPIRVEDISMVEFNPPIPSVSPVYTTLTPVLSPVQEILSPARLMSNQDIKPLLPIEKFPVNLTMPFPVMSSPASSVSSSFSSELSPPPQMSPPMLNSTDRHHLILRKLVQAHRQHTISLTEVDKDFIYQQQLKYKETHEVKTEAFGHMTPFLSNEIYDEIFALTGLDVDNRKRKIQIVTDALDHLLRTQARFAISIPGFSTLTKEDQTKLISGAYKETWFLNAYFGMNQDLGVILMPNMDLYTMSEFSWFMSEGFTEKCFQNAKSFQNLNVDYELLVLWKVMLLLVTDRDELDEPNKVSQLQDFYVECLLDHIRLTRPENNNLFRDIIFHSLRLRDIDNTMSAPLSVPMSHLNEVVRKVLDEESQSFNS